MPVASYSHNGMQSCCHFQEVSVLPFSTVVYSQLPRAKYQWPLTFNLWTYIQVTVVIAIGAKMSSFAMLSFTVLNLVVIGFIVIGGAVFADVHNWTGGAGFFPYGASGVRTTGMFLNQLAKPKWPGSNHSKYTFKSLPYTVKIWKYILNDCFLHIWTRRIQENIRKIHVPHGY